MDWHQRFGSRGLVIIGVHSPEFFWEKNLDRVEAATKDLGIPYAVAIDNDFSTWKLYGTRYWPTLHIIDKKGVVRYTRIGEGGYPEIESVLQRLLEEP